MPRSSKKTPRKVSRKKATKATTRATKSKSSKSTSATRARKKVSTRKTVLPLVHARDAECFWVTNGQVLQNLQQLADAFKSMSKAVYTYHVSKDHNDFADWVAAVLKDDDCAAALRGVRSPSGSYKVMQTHLRRYKI